MSERQDTHSAARNGDPRRTHDGSSARSIDGESSVSGNALRLEAGARVAGWCARHPVLVVALWVVALGLAGWSISRLTISASLAAMLGDGARAAAATQRITSGMQSGDDLLVVAEAPAGASRDEAVRALALFAERFPASLMSDPASRGVVAAVRSGEEREIAAYVREVVLPNAAFFLSDAQFEAALRKLAPDEIRTQIAQNESMIAAPGAAMGALSGAILRDPLRLFEVIGEGGSGRGAGGITGMSAGGIEDAGGVPAARPEVSADGRAVLIRIAGVEPSGNLDAARRLVDLAAEHAAKVNTGGLVVRLGGPAPIGASAARVIREDAIVSTIVSVGLLAVLFAVFYRRWTASLLIGGVACAGMVVGVGVVGVFLREVSPLGVMIAALLVGLGTDYGIHFLSHYDAARAEGSSCVEASARTAREMAIPIATNCLTSIFGFASLWPSEIKMLSDFATLGAAGLVGALLAVFLLLPAVLALVDAKRPARESAAERFGRVADGIASRPRGCIAVCAVALTCGLVGAAVQGFALKLEPDLSVMHPRPNPALETTMFVMERFSGRGEVVPVEVRSESPEGLLRAAHDVARAIQAAEPPIPGLTGVAGLHQLAPDPRGAAGRTARLAAFDARGSLEAFDRAVEESSFDPAAYAGYRKFLEKLLGARSPVGIAEVAAHAEVAERLFPRGAGASPTSTVLLVTLGGPMGDREHRGAAMGALTRVVDAVPGATVAGMVAVSEELQAAVQTGLPRSVAISVALVLVWLLIVFRRPMDVLLALVPLVVAGGSTVLFMIATGQNFNPINSVAIPLLDGIAVDAGVFLVATARAHGGTREGLVRHLRLTTHAVMLAAGTTLTAFMALAISHTPAIRSLGLVASVGITAAFGAVLLVLMPVLILRAPRQEHSPQRHREHREERD